MQCCNPEHPLSLPPLQLSELMSETRREVEKEHERRKERMREEHREALARIRAQYEEEVPWWLHSVSHAGFPVSSVCLCCISGEPRASLRCFPVSLGGQEHKQRSELLEGLRSEAARLRQLHDADVKGLQAELEGRLSALQQRHREKVSSRLCLWPLGLLGDSLHAPHLVPLPPCSAQFVFSW